MVVGFGSDLAGCTCSQTTQGNISRHQIKCLLLSGHSESSLLQRLGTSFGTAVGATEDSEGETETTDIHDATAEQQAVDVLEPPELVEVMDYAPPVENVHGESHENTHIRVLSKEEAVNLVRAMWRSAGDDTNLLAYASMLLTNAHESLKKLIARKSTLETVAVEPFVPVAGSDNSLCRKSDFLESSFSRCGSRNDSRKRVTDDTAGNSNQGSVAVSHMSSVNAPYDGDNVKFQIPMAYTITTLARGVIELGHLQCAFHAIEWGTDYIINAPEPNVLWPEVKSVGSHVVTGGNF
ncbi:hypothetical protein R1sor_022299 [Riccia sorocarpa]|uniref:cellulase n=1 Tax=Riccia sorocarpa TaxID=122646 RepID=A0ABD3GK64_9MARC